MKNFILQLQVKPAVKIASSSKGLTRYTKELIKVGKYVKDSVGLAFEVTHDTLVHWQNTFEKWIANGNKVPIPLGHDSADEPEKNAGWVQDMYIVGDALIGVLELADPKLALTTDVSIYVPPEFVDGHGRKYIQPITHVALCTNPVIPGLKDFQELSLSLGDNEVDKKMLAKMLGLAEDADESAIKAAITKATAKEVVPDKVLSQTKVDPTNNVLVNLVAENRIIKIASLVKAGLVIPAVKTAIEDQYTKKDTLALSLSGGWDDGFDFLLKILAENATVALGEKSGQQLIELANTRAKGPENVIASDITRRRRDAGLDK